MQILAYITIRPERVKKGSENWLDKHNFPQAPVICRPNELVGENGHKWKAKILKELYPQILGIIDDNAKILEFLAPDYQGKVFLYEHHDNFNYPFVLACKNWLEVYLNIKKYANRFTYSHNS
jgi:hypothetical protein